MGSDAGRFFLAARDENCAERRMVPYEREWSWQTLYSTLMFVGAGAILSGIVRGISRRQTVFWLVAVVVFVMHIAVPPIVLSLARKPVDYFTWNPWLKRLPDFMTSGPGSLRQRLDKVWDLALFWFSSDNPLGIEWGFAVTTADLARFAWMSLLIGAYFALWMHLRAQAPAPSWGVRATGQGGAVGAVASVCGLATGGCTVMGCGAPIIPVVGLAFTGLSSGTLKWMSNLSAMGTPVAMLGLTVGILYLGWQIGRCSMTAATRNIQTSPSPTR